MRYRNLVLSFFKLSFKILEAFSSYFLTLSTRKVHFDKNYLVNFFPVYLNACSEYGILMQGPIILEKDFTYNTLKLYKHIYPNVVILLSTWEGQSNETLSKIRDLGIIVVENVEPVYKGILNINLQILSTKVGIYELKKLNVKFLLKVRTDQRNFNNIDFLSAMRNLQKTFPINNTALKFRLIICSTNTFRSRLYGITDMLMFGHIKDMEKFWCIPLELNDSQTIRYLEPSYYMKNEIGEGYLIKHFSNILGFNFHWTIDDSLKFIVSYFCIIDKEQLGFFWLKYDRFFESIDFFRYKDHINWERFVFSDWLNEYYKSNDVNK
jgi:hypothetical protein